MVRAGHLLLGAPPFERLGWLNDELTEQYQPGGPPQSPVYDSYLVQHVLSGIPQGLARETPYTVVARLSSGDRARERLHELAEALASSHLDYYRVTRASQNGAELVAVRDDRALSVLLAGPFLREGDRFLGRVVPFGEALFIADSPYLLQASEQEWLDYFERVASASVASRRAPAASGPTPASKPRLTSKQAARRRKEQQLRAARNAPSEIIVRHLRQGSSERFWLDYFMAGYAGQRRGIVRLAGVPDRPESLPHGRVDDDHDAEQPPMARIRTRLVRIAEREGLFEREELAFAEAARALGATDPVLHEADRYYFAAHCTLGARTEQGATALDLLEREQAQAPLDPDEQAVVVSLKRGGFAALRLDRVRLDAGFDAYDLAAGAQLRIAERSATRQVAAGDVLLGWLCKDPAGQLTLEGGAVRITAFFVAAISEATERLRDERRARFPDESAGERAAALALPLLAHVVTLRQHPPRPALYNTSGDRLQLATGRYTIIDRARVRAGLVAAGFQAEGAALDADRASDRFGWAERGTSIAQLELVGETLLVHVNSLERLRSVKDRIEAALGDAVRPHLTSLDGDAESLFARADAQGDAAATGPLDIRQFPPEAVRQLHDMLLGTIRQRLDDPIPQFKGRSLKQLARGPRTRADAISWLREQERIFKLNPQMTGLDMRPLWAELGLEYQGLDTDRE